jgi:hypothetical protein
VRVATPRLLVIAGLVLAVTASLLAAGQAGAKNLPSTIYVDKGGGYRITIPKTWQVIPPSLAAVKKKVAQLKKQKKADLASVYSSYISTASARKELSEFRFRAFMWPALPSPVPTDVSLRIQPVSKTYKTADLPAIGASFAKNMSSPGAKIAEPQLLKLPAGSAILITGTVPLPKEFQGAKTGFTLVLLLRPGRLYMLSFRIDSRAAADAKIFTSIASLFRFV